FRTHHVLDPTMRARAGSGCTVVDREQEHGDAYSSRALGRAAGRAIAILIDQFKDLLLDLLCLVRQQPDLPAVDTAVLAPLVIVLARDPLVELLRETVHDGRDDRRAGCGRHGRRLRVDLDV